MKCPKCSSIKIIYKGNEIDGNKIRKSCECSDCHCIFVVMSEIRTYNKDGLIVKQFT